ncbi:MAG TPA: thioredoxin family protein [Ignavibacteriales bacterium]|nr:thioredoxin family protein [Ignavibacteriales bacterium]
MVKDFFKKQTPQKGLAYNEMVSAMLLKIETTIPEQLDEEARHQFEIIKLNFQRIRRINKTYTPSEDIIELVNNIKAPQLWMAISEDWCGDSAQNLPYIAKMAELNSNIDMRIISRDANPEIIDQYLTNGTRSIPIVVAFDEQGNELFKWGPRPAEGQALVNKAKSEGVPKDKFLEALHVWYAKNKGVALEEEFKVLLQRFKKTGVEVNGL